MAGRWFVSDVINHFIAIVASRFNVDTSMSFIIGLTGGIGSGKTSVANLFAKHGITVVDADRIAHQSVASGSKALETITEHFGSSILDQQHALNRVELRQRIFDNPDEREWLETLLHPLIRKTILSELAESTSIYTLLVAPLLLETNLHCHTHKILVIDVSEETQIKRTVDRDNNSPQQVQSIINAQIKRDQRLAKADFVINNDGEYEQLQERVDELDQLFRELALELNH